MRLGRYVRWSMTAAIATVIAHAPYGTKSAEAKDLVIGAINSLDGPAAFVGIVAKAGVEVATEMINKDPEKYLGSKDRKLVVDMRNGGTSLSDAVSLGREFARNADCVAIVGPSLTPQAIALGPFAQQSKIPLLIMTSPGIGLTDPGDYVFVQSQNGPRIAEMDVKVYMKLHPNTKSAGVMSVTDNQSIIVSADAAEKAFKDAGVTVTKTAVPFASLDYSSSIDVLKQANVEVIYLGQGGPGMAAAVQQAKRVGFSPQYVSYGSMVGPSVMKNVGNLLNGAIVATDYDPNLPTPLNKAFFEAFKKLTNNDPDTYGALGFNSVMVIANAIKSISGDVTRDKVRDALPKVNMESILGAGNFSFAADRTIASLPAMLQVENGEVKSFKP